jgi:hypothetical protein
LADDLENWLVGQPIWAQPESSLRRVWRRLRQPTVLAIGTLVLLLIGTTGFILATRPEPLPKVEDPGDVIDRQLLAGNEAILVGPKGLPARYAVRLGDSEPRVLDGEGDGAMVVHSLGVALLELLAHPLCESYVLRAEIAHKASAANGEVGLYFIHQERDRAGVPEHYFVYISFADTGINAGEVHSGVCRIRGPHETDNAHCFSDPTFEKVPQKWRTLVVLVTPDRITATLDQTEVGSATLDDINKSARRRTPSGVTPPTLGLDGGLGIYVSAASAYVRNVTVQSSR